ncbi:MAG: class I SAM-dependent methyltransferase [Candidatus Wallbacteria bacterium]|nr:class I SAM-dependent methyltransferase [Candidatus Wallbacteria bacterium]
MIRFLAKVAVQRALGTIPFGPELYRRRQARSVLASPVIATNIGDKHRTALQHLELLRETAGLEPRAVEAHLELGSGWLPVIPLTFSRHGMRRQVLTDVSRLLCREAVPDLVRRLAVIDTGGVELTPLGRGVDPLAAAGISYHAPVSPPLPLPTGGFDLATCTQVLLYPPPAVVRALHEEAARCLRPGGLYLATIRLDDLYALSDPALPRFHFLRYSRATWSRWFDNAFTPLNRLRPCEHARLLEGLPFERLTWRVEGGGSAELEQLALSRPHAEFAHLPASELAATNLTFLLRRV